MNSPTQRGSKRGAWFHGVPGVLAVAGAGLMIGNAAHAGIVGPEDDNCVYVFEQNAQTGFYNNPNDEVGELAFIESMYNPNTGQFDWTVGYNANGDGELPEGFSLTVNDGPVPDHITGYLAAVYFDATDPNNPIVSAYAYNGDDSATSHKYGTSDWVYDANTDTWSPPTDAPDPIASSLDPGTASFLNSASVDTSGVLADVVFSMSLDAGAINSHVPAYPNNGPGWLGLAYSTSIGAWQHGFKSFNAQYDQDGYLTQWEFDRATYGWYDFTDGAAEKVPEPVAALLAPAALLMLRRRSA